MRSVSCFMMPEIGVACERLRFPRLQSEPIALLGEDGVVRAASAEARRFGVRIGQARTGARALCDGLEMLPYDASAYEELARSVWDVLAVESSFVEPDGPEICYAAWDGQDICERVLQAVRQSAERIASPVKAGLATSKFVARVAARRNPAEVAVVEPGMESAALASVALREVSDLDARLLDRLERLGVRTLGDVLRLPPDALCKPFGEFGLRLYRLALGEDGERVRPVWPPRTLAHVVRFDDEVAESAALEHSMRICAGRIADRLADQGEFCRMLTLEVEVVGGRHLAERERLAAPSRAPGVLTGVAARLFRRMAPDAPLLSLGLEAGDLDSGGGMQLTLFDENEHGQGLPYERRARLNAAVAFLTRRYGSSSVQRASACRQACRIRLWSEPLGPRLDEEIAVETDGEGVPVRYFRRGGLWNVVQVVDRWRESDWSREGLAERTVYRVETAPAGFSELHHTCRGWRLVSVAD